MNQRLAIDYAWEKPSPAAIKAANYEGVLRYLSHTASKNLTGSEAAHLLAAGLWIGVVWETTANRATQGAAAGRVDVQAAEAQAAALGYPKTAVIFYAVDFDARPGQVADYFKAVRAASTHPVGVYGGIDVVDGISADYYWQTAAWSHGRVSRRAHLYQRVSHTRPIGGSTSGWDENVVIKDIPAWRKPAPQPAPAPAPSGQVKPPAVKPAKRPARHAANHVTAGRAALEAALTKFDAVPRKRVAVWAMVRAIRAALKVGPKS